MTEQLSKRGVSGEGAEQVRNVLSSYLSALLDVVDQFRGDVIKVKTKERRGGEKRKKREDNRGEGEEERSSLIALSSMSVASSLISFCSLLAMLFSLPSTMRSPSGKQNHTQTFNNAPLR